MTDERLTAVRKVREKADRVHIARRGEFKKGKVEVARKLATILHAMWKTGEEFRWTTEAQAKAA